MDSGWQGMHQDLETHQDPMSQGEMGQYGGGPIMSRQSIRSVQQNLNRLGFHAGPEDGIMGTQTRRAVTAYQTHMGMAPNGILTPDLANRIMAGSTASDAN
jgi:peptidoglycan hydrolase-like protein with peptidoglycan-binding domain